LETSRPVYPAALPPGTIVGSWRLLGLTSRGAYAVVFRAERTDQPEAGPFALKLALLPEDSRIAPEVELLTRTRHSNVPRLHDFGQWSGPGGALFPFLVTDWFDGLSLYSWARLRPRSSREALRVLAKAASALQAIHASGGIHRDFKGDTLLVRPEDGEVMLTDFGSCTFLGAPIPPGGSEPPGTPQYHSPQSQLHQWKYRRKPAARYENTAADDVYALGITAYRLTTGRYPLIAAEMSLDTDLEEFFSVFPDLVPAEALAEISPELTRWIRQMLTVDPVERGTAHEMAVALALAEKTEGPEADEPIVPRRDREVGDSEVPRRPASRPALEWQTKLKGTAVFLLMAAGGGGLLHALLEPLPPASASVHIPAAQAPAPESETSGMGELALPEPLSAAEPMPAQQGISAAVPAEPLPGQRLPPCKGPQLEINGGCWYLVGNTSPPCAETTYEWRKRCYAPSMGPPRPSTTGEK
jgi:serine/threonine protein kinase